MVRQLCPREDVAALEDMIQNQPNEAGHNETEKTFLEPWTGMQLAFSASWCMSNGIRPQMDDAEDCDGPR